MIDVPDLELVGVRVYDGDKVGTDAGDLAGRAPTGVLATDSNAEILALAPDVVLYMGRVEHDPDGCFADVVELLAAGIDVITTGQLVHRHPAPSTRAGTCHARRAPPTGARSWASGCSPASGARSSRRVLSRLVVPV